MRRSSLLCLPLALLSLAAPAGCGDDLSAAGDGGAGTDGGPAQTIHIDGLDGPTQVYADQNGILHIQCTTDHDCFAAEGYFHAAHRFAQMDLRRRLGRGRLSELAGNVTLATDEQWRMMMLTRDGHSLAQQLLDAADPATRASLEAYSDGVNAWLADLAANRNGAELSQEYTFPLLDRTAIQTPWEPIDSVGCILPLLAQLTDQSAEEIELGNVVAALGPDVAGDLFTEKPAVSSPVLAPATVARGHVRRARHLRLRRSIARSAAARMRAARHLLALALALAGRPHPSLERGARGSNNWVVSPSHGGGMALLANDPHLPLSHPAIWYLVHLDAVTHGTGTVHAAGVSFPGLPGIVLGQNQDIAWGATTTYFDQVDVYVETLDPSGTGVMFEGQDVPFIQVQQTFQVSGRDPVQNTVLVVPHHGPVVAIDQDAGTALTVRWTGADATTDINLFTRLMTAGSVDEAKAALESSTTVGNNFVVADRAGHVGWFPYNRLPTRPWASAARPPWLPLPGDGSAEWGDYIPYADLPQAEDPAAGFLATANNDMTGALADGDPTNDGQDAIQRFVAPGFRHQRIVERLAAAAELDLSDMQSIQGDVLLGVGRATTPAILAAVSGATLDADAQAVALALTDWDDQCPTGLEGDDPDSPASTDATVLAEARGCAAFHAVWGRLSDLTFGDELAAAGVQHTALDSALVLALTQPDALSQSYWDDVSTGAVETEADTVAAALSEAGALLRQKLGDDPNDWLWGRLHTVTLRADLFDAAGVSDFNSPTYARDGGLYTVNVGNPSNPEGGSFDMRAGASMRLACAAGSEAVTCTIELPGGERHLRDSPFYDNLLPGWLDNQPIPLTFSVDQVAQDPAEHILVEP